MALNKAEIRKDLPKNEPSMCVSSVDFKILHIILTLCLVPTSAPSRITVQLISSSSVVVTWGDVPVEHQNGIIIGYRVYMKADRSGGESYVEATSSKQWSKSGLDLWTSYNITISAITSVGEGVQSAVMRVRTDEEGNKYLP